MNDTEKAPETKAPAKKWQIKAFTHTDSGRPMLWWQGTIAADDMKSAAATLIDCFPLMMADATRLEIGQVNERAPRQRKATD